MRGPNMMISKIFVTDRKVGVAALLDASARAAEGKLNVAHGGSKHTQTTKNVGNQ